MTTRRDRESGAVPTESADLAQRDAPAPPSETRQARSDVARDIVSLLALLLGGAGALFCLAHLGWWAVGLVASIVTVSIGLSGARRSADEEGAVVEHLIEIRHTEDRPPSNGE